MNNACTAQVIYVHISTWNACSWRSQRIEDQGTPQKKVVQCLSKEHFFFYHQQCFKILHACQTSFQGLLHFLGTCWNKYLWGLFAIAIIPQDIINYYQYYYYYYYLTRCEQKVYVQNLKMLSQGQLDVLHLKHFNFFIKQINSFQWVD